MSEIKFIIEPDPDEAEAAEIFVDGTVGDRPYRFRLDTGAGRTHLPLDDYTTAFENLEKRTSSGVFANDTDDLIAVPSITVGPNSRQNFRLVRTYNQEARLNKLLGMDILKDFKCHFRFDENRLLLDEDDPTRLFEFLFLDKGFHPYIEVEFGSGIAKAVWDTGAALTVVDLNTITNYPTFFEEAGTSTGTDATGASVQTPMFVMSGTRIGQQNFPPQRVAGVDLSGVNATIEVPMNLILGYNTLSKANWLFDFPNQGWAITKMLG